MATRSSKRKIATRSNTQIKKTKLKESAIKKEQMEIVEDIETNKKTPIYKRSNTTDTKTTENESIYEFDAESEEKKPDLPSTKIKMESNLNIYTKQTKPETTSDRKCKLCDKVFENALELLRHSREFHIFPKTVLSFAEIKKYFNNADRSLCPICEKPIKTRNFRSMFIRHLMVHTNGLSFECKVCNMTFRRKDHMQSHEKRHIVTK